MIRVFIADDHALLAESLQFKLQQDEAIDIVGIATNGDEAVKRCLELRPDVALLDIKMPGCTGIQACAMIKKACPEIKIAILTTFEERGNVIDAVSQGSDGYILKEIKPEELSLAVKCIFHGFMVLHGSLKSFIKEMVGSFKSKNQNPLEKFLKEEDIEIIRLICDGKNNKEIADLLNYSEGTIKNRVSKLMEKLEVDDRTQLAVFALKNDLI